MTATEPTTDEIPFTLNGQALTARPGELLIDACDRLGVHIPRFCYHPRMTPVGMCRMCLVEVDTGRGPGLQPSCMLTVTPEMVVNTESETSVAAQDGVLELLLINHPLDCPVCDKGGECPLQDNAYAYGPGESRFVEEKRHYEKPIPISDLVYLDRERCILCDRCTRFADEVAGDPLIHFMDRGAQTQVNTFPEHPFSSYFSGNTVQICPVGALTAEPYRFKARPWDLAEVESTSTVDSTGAAVALQSSRDRLVRIQGVDSDAVNWGWLSDKERFAYEATDSEDRLTDPLVRDGDQLVARRWNDALAVAAEALSVPADRIGVIGGARLPLEGQFAWSSLLRDGLGVVDLDAQLGDGLPASAVLGLPRATIAQAVEPGGVVVLLGADPKEELPTLFLRLRHAVVADGAALVELTPWATGLSPHAAVSLHARPGEVGQVAAAIADGRTGDGVGGVSASALARAAELLGSGRPVTVVVGRANLAESPQFTLDAIAAIRRLVPDVRFLSGLRRGNVHGALSVGLSPEVGLDGRPLGTSGRDTIAMLEAAAAGDLDTLVLLGADPLGDVADRALAERAIDAVDHVVAVDGFLTDSSERASVVLPAALAGEVDGSFCNLEGRLLPLRAKVTPPGQARADWVIALELADALGHPLDVVDLAGLRAMVSAAVPAYADIDWATDVDRGTTDGPIVDLGAGFDVDLGTSVVPPAPDGYGLRLVVDRTLWDEGTMVRQSSSLRALARPATLSLAAGDFDGLGIADGDDVTVEWSGGSVTVPARRDASLPRGSARLPFRAPGVDAAALIDHARPVTDIRVTVG